MIDHVGASSFGSQDVTDDGQVDFSLGGLADDGGYVIAFAFIDDCETSSDVAVSSTISTPPDGATGPNLLLPGNMDGTYGRGVLEWVAHLV